MKKVQKILFRYFWILIACVISSSCSEDENVVNGVVEGLPVSISFELTTPAPGHVTTRATDAEETKVEKLMLFFFNVDNPNLHKTWEIADVGMPGTVSSTNYTYNISVPYEAGVTSGRWYVYALANWDKAFWDKNFDIKSFQDISKADMDAYLVKKTSVEDPDFKESALLLTGKYHDAQNNEIVTFTRDESNPDGVNRLDRIHLKRSVAKIRFYFVNGQGVKFTPISYDIHNYCLTSTLIERQGWNGTATPNEDLLWCGGSESDPKRSGAFIDFTERKVGFNNVVIDGQQKPFYGFQFYMPENVQHLNKDITPEQKSSLLGNKLLREKSRGTEGTRRQFLYAPDNSTYVVVHGKYEGPGKDGQGKVAADVHYTILLGDFSTQNSQGKPVTGSNDNFTVRRNTKYDFKVSVNGVNNIITEATAISDDGEVQPGAEGDVVNSSAENVKLLDAHYETCMISFNVADVTNLKDYSLVLNTPKDKRIADRDHLLEGKDYGWVEFCKPQDKNTFIPYPTPENKPNTLYSVVDLIDKLQDKKTPLSNNFLVDGEKIYIQAFVNEFYYNDLAENKEFSKFVNVPNRVMTLATSRAVSTDGKSSYTSQPIFSIEQRSIKTMYSLDPNYFDYNKDTHNQFNPFGLETVEEVENPVFIHSGFTGVRGSNEKDFYSGDRNNDGYFNCINLDDGSSHNGASQPTTSLIGQEWSKFVNLGTNKMVDAENNGLFQFLIRNRDENGNGIIDADEIKWFIPSVNQHIAIWNGFYALTASARLNSAILYYTSNNGMYRSLWAYEGVFGAYKNKSGDNYGHNQVRCIRALNPHCYNLHTSPSTLYDYDTKTFYVSGFGPNAIRKSFDIVGEYGQHSQNDPKNKLPEAFQVADNYLPDTYTIQDLSRTDLCTNFDDGKPETKGQWRLPNQRELLVMLLVQNTPGYNATNIDIQGYTGCSTYYDGSVPNQSGNDKRPFYVQENADFITSSKAWPSSIKIRPVRDVAPKTRQY